MNFQEEPLSDDELILQAASGDQDAFGALYERYLDDIYRYVYYRVHDVEEAEDLTEMVFLRAWENLLKNKKKVNVFNFRAWIYRITHNLVIDYKRKKKPISVELEDLSRNAEAVSPASDKIVERQLSEAELVAAINSLEDRLQQIIILRFISELSHAETAAVLGLNKNHVRVLQYRALKKLRLYLE